MVLYKLQGSYEILLRGDGRTVVNEIYHTVHKLPACRTIVSL